MIEALDAAGDDSAAVGVDLTVDVIAASARSPASAGSI